MAPEIFSDFATPASACPVNEDAGMSSFIESDAREVLLRRRRSLSDHETVPASADPAARWSDWEAAHEPLSATVRRELAEIDAALTRIAEGQYGRCQSCGGPLGLQRLRALPEARYCVSCSGMELRADE
jgi:RNA polymerase-binding transcription factor DksA